MAEPRDPLDAVPLGLQVWEAVGEELELRCANREPADRVAPEVIRAVCVDQREQVLELARWRVHLRPLGGRRVLVAFEDVREERLNRAIVEQLQAGVLVVAADGTILQANRALARLARLDRIEIGGNVRDVGMELRDLEGEALAVDDTPRMRALRGEAVRAAVVRLVYPGGGGAWVEVNASPLVEEEGARPFATVITYEDVSARFEDERRVRHEADHDPLTGLANRRALGRTITAAVARAEQQGQAVAVLILDLDGFKAVNDRLGHAAGDAVLREVASRLQASVRDRDLVARAGGDEFVIVLSDLVPGSGAAVRCRARVATALAQPFAVHGAPIPLRAAIGVAHFPADGRDGAEVLAHADRAMYAEKAGGAA